VSVLSVHDHLVVRAAVARLVPRPAPELRLPRPRPVTVVRVPAVPTELRRCVYCGARTGAEACRAHRDLVARDPNLGATA
jgi:hypothetical protein